MMEMSSPGRGGDSRLIGIHENSGNESIPLLGQARDTGSVASSTSTKTILATNDIISSSPSPAFFAETSYLRTIFLRSAVGHKMRARMCLGWGLFSLALAFAVLKLHYKNTSARSFFIASTTLTTIGYAMSSQDGATADYPFLSVFFLLFVWPFSFLQSVVYIDATYSNSTQLNTRIAARCRRGYNAASAFIAELWAALTMTCLLILFLLILGTLCYSYFGKLTSWRKGIFYAITSATTIGYGSFEVENDYGYYAVGLYAIACSYTIGVIFPSLAAFFIVAADNIEKVGRIRKEEEALSSTAKFRRDLEGAIM